MKPTAAFAHVRLDLAALVGDDGERAVPIDLFGFFPRVRGQRLLDEFHAQRRERLGIGNRLVDGPRAAVTIDRSSVEKIVAEQRGIPLPVLGANRSLEQYLASARIIENTVPIAVAGETARLAEPPVNAAP